MKISCKRHQQNNTHLDRRISSTSNIDAHDDKISSLKQQIEEVKHQLQNFETHKAEEKRALYQRKVHQKAAIRKQLEAKYAPLLVEDTSLDEKRQEIQKIVQYLVEDNVRLRDQIQYHQKRIRSMKLSNLRLEETHKSVEAATAQLRIYIQTAEEANGMLIHNTKSYKAALRTMKLDLKERDAYCTHESRMTHKYEHCIGRITRQIEVKGESDLTEAIAQED
ncbi:MAG: hypothetical protein SGBAC_008698 [Bacillariaceae sp.]